MKLKDFRFRIESFPTNFLVWADEKILSMSRQEIGEPDLRRKNLLNTLNEILPKNNSYLKAEARTIRL